MLKRLGRNMTAIPPMRRSPPPSTALPTDRWRPSREYRASRRVRVRASPITASALTSEAKARTAAVCAEHEMRNTVVASCAVKRDSQQMGAEEHAYTDCQR